MIPYGQALDILRRAAAERGAAGEETVALHEALGRVCAQRVLSAESLPRFDNSAMDGFAVVAGETSSASGAKPLRLPVLGSLAAGDEPRDCSRGRPGPCAYEIMTGAPIPGGFDAVVKVEDTTVLEGGRAVAVSAPVQPGEHVRCAGEDFKAGVTVLDPGTMLEPAHLLALAALGVSDLSVRRRPKAGLISTGRELVPYSKMPGPGQVRNASGLYIPAALRRLGAEVEDFGTSPDDPADFRRRLERAMGWGADLVVTTGAVSMGRYDFVADAVTSMGAQTLFHKTATRPGKPGLFARFPNGPLLFGLPGNPVSSVVVLRFFAVPVLRRLLGMREEEPVRLRLEAPVAKRDGIRCFLKARASVTPEGGSVRVLPGQGSFELRPLLEANAWAVMPEPGDGVPAGTVVDVFPSLPNEGGWGPR